MDLYALSESSDGTLRGMVPEFSESRLPAGDSAPKCNAANTSVDGAVCTFKSSITWEPMGT